MITKDEVQHIAKLARIGLKKGEIKKFQKELSLILDYIEKLKKVDIAQADFFSPVAIDSEKLRKDEETKEKKAAALELLKLSPKAKEDFVKVKKVLP